IRTFRFTEPFQTLFLTIQAEICLRLLKNREESKILQKSPGRIWRWDPIAENFVPLEALKSNNGLVCSVDFLKDLAVKSIEVVADNMNPYIIINANQSQVTGFIGDVWTTLEETLKFTFVYKPLHYEFGIKLSGIVGRLDADEWSSSRTLGSYGDLLLHLRMVTHSYALFVQSEGTRVSTWWYASIFSRNLWRVTGLFILCIVFIIMGINALRKTVCKFDIECDNELSSPSFVFLYVLSGISGQGCQKIPSSWSLRLTVLSFLFMGMSLFCGFSSTLTSYLTIGITSVPLTSLKDVAEKRTHSLCVRNNSGAYIHFTVNGLRGEDLMPEWKDLVNKDCPDMMDMLTIGSNLCTPGFVYLEGPDIFLSIYQQVLNQCHYVQLPQPYWTLKLAFQHARSSKYKKIIDLYLMRLRSVDNILGQPQWTDFQAVEYDHIHIVFSMLSIAALFSVLICVLENIYYRWQRLPQEKTSCVINRKIIIP
ncbi:glutamate receptor U1-like, partial [Vespula squamosa]